MLGLWHHLQSPAECQQLVTISPLLITYERGICHINVPSAICCIERKTEYMLYVKSRHFLCLRKDFRMLTRAWIVKASCKRVLLLFNRVDIVSIPTSEQTKPVVVRHVSPCPSQDIRPWCVDRGRVRSHTCRWNTSFSAHEALSPQTLNTPV